MNEIEVQIFNIKNIHGYPDVLLSIYCNNALLDATTIEPDIQDPIVFSVSSIGKQVILITVKSISLNVFIGFAKFKLADLIDPDFILTLPLALEEDYAEPSQVPSLSVQSIQSPLSSSGIGRKALNGRIVSQARDEWSRWEYQVVRNLKKSVKMRENFKYKFKEIKKNDKNQFVDWKELREKMIDLRFIDGIIKRNDQSKEIVLDHEDLEIQVLNNKILILNLEAEGKKTKAEIDFYSKMMKRCDKLAGRFDEDVESDIEEIKRRIELIGKEQESMDLGIKRDLDTVFSLHNENSRLRKCISDIESGFINSCN